MLDPQDLEVKALQEAGMAGGEYLESIRQTDLRQLTSAQWGTFVKAVVGCYVDQLQSAANRLREVAAELDAKVTFRPAPPVELPNDKPPF